MKRNVLHLNRNLSEQANGRMVENKWTNYAHLERLSKLREKSKIKFLNSFLILR